ncbi:hypothetical protein DFH06DRAFT_1349061 [Mycena polygramma]|nr:hypothetical protein DFH06DRAFT_1349061 [Mycena polygramma]
MTSHTKEDADAMQVTGSGRLEGPDIVEQNEDSDDNMPALEEVESDDDDENNTLDLERRAAVWATTAASRRSSAFLHARLTAARRGLPDLGSADLQKGEPNVFLTMPLMAIDGNFRLKTRISYDVACQWRPCPACPDPQPKFHQAAHNNQCISALSWGGDGEITPSFTCGCPPPVHLPECPLKAAVVRAKL